MVKKKVNKKNISKKKEKVCELFEIKKDGEKGIEKVCGFQGVEEVKKDQVKNENKILRNILFIFGGILIIFLATYFLAQSSKTFEYKNMKFEILDEGNVRFYSTSFNLKLNNTNINYTLYLRKDPRTNDKEIKFEGDLIVSKIIVLNSTGNFNCEGRGVISNYRFNEFFGYLGATIMNDPNATCDDQRRYTFINIQEGEETKIEQYGPSCYNFYVNECEILEVTERFILETLPIIN